MPKGTMGQRWDKGKIGNWNLKFEDGETNEEFDPTLTFLGKSDDVLQVEFTEFGLNKKAVRGVPVKYIETVDGKKIPTVTVYDLTFGQYGVGRGLPVIIQKIITIKMQAYTPAWQEIFTGIGKKLFFNLHVSGVILLKLPKVNVW
jgi:nitrate reductase alpha subunit